MRKPRSKANEQLALEEIKVTAFKREQNLQDTQATIQAFTGELLEIMNAHNMEDLFMSVPSMNYAPNPFGERGGANIIIRGISNTRLSGVDASGNTGTVGFYINEVPVTPPDMEIMDVNRIEILKGPQGTTYGQGSMGGNVKVVLNKPNLQEIMATVSSSVETTNGGGENYGAEAVINLPLFKDKMGVRLSVYNREDSGFIDIIRPTFSDTQVGDSVIRTQNLNLRDTFDGLGNLDKNANKTTSRGARFSLRYIPNQKFTFDASASFQDKTHADGMNSFAREIEALANEPSPEGFPGPESPIGTQEDLSLLAEKFLPEELSTELFVADIEMNYDLGPVKLTSISAFQSREYSENVDFTRIMFAVFGGTPEGNIAGASGLGTEIKTDTYMQEFRIQSTGESRGNSLLDRLEWTLGASYWQEERIGAQFVGGVGLGDVFNFNEIAANPVSFPNTGISVNEWDHDDDNLSFFGNLTLNLTDKLSVNGGVRHFDTTVEFQRNLTGDLVGSPFGIVNVVGGNRSEKGWTPKAGLAYEANEDVLFYTSAAKGFRSGGSVSPVESPQCIPVVEEQGLESFSGGFDSDTLWTYEAGIKTAWAQNRFVINASAFHSDWTNLQQSIVLSQFPGNCTRVLTANVGSAEVDGFEADFVAHVTPNLTLRGFISFTDAKLGEPDPRISGQVKGAELQNVPKWQGSVSFDYRRQTDIGQAFIRGDWSYVDDRHSTLGVSSNSFFNFAAYDRLSFRTGLNLENWGVKLYVQNALDEQPALSALRISTTDSTTLQPRTVGMSVNYRF